MLLRRVSRFLAAALCLLTASLYAQTNASIYGSVIDTSGGVVAKAAVTATNNRTGVTQRTVSNTEGVYIFPSLQPGEYQVTAELAGFRKGVVANIQLAVGSKISLDFKLEIGSATESVTVAENSSPLETVNTSVSNVVSLQRVQDLPLQNRDAGALIALQAGVRVAAISIPRSPTSALYSPNRDQVE